jgi:spermidine synthase
MGPSPKNLRYGARELRAVAAGTSHTEGTLALRFRRHKERKRFLMKADTGLDPQNYPSMAAAQAPSRLSVWLVRLIPPALVFLSAFCLMVVELVAPRLVARHLGSSIYTWTSVIAVVLGGLGLGNYIGGWLADRFRPRWLLPLLFFVSSVLVLSTIWLSEILGSADQLPWLPVDHWPYRVLLVIFAVFFAPAAALGTISPVVATMALEQSRRIGITIGNIYAWGNIGAIVGTLMAGFVLIAELGCKAVLSLVAAVLALVGAALAAQGLFQSIWAGVCLAILFLALAPSHMEWAARAAARLYLRPHPDEYFYYDESQYYTIKVGPDETGVLRELVLDHLVHGYVHPDNPLHLEYEYELSYVEVLRRAGALPSDWPTERHRQTSDDEGEMPKFPLEKIPPKPIRTFFIGGGSYTFPRLVEALFPKAEVIVAEIDPAVTRAAHEALFLPTTTAIRTIWGDARITVRHLLGEIEAGRRPPFNFVFGDAFHDFSVPWHLTTWEFNEQIRRMMTPEGVYMINIIDSFDSAKFLGAYVQTARRTFPHVTVLSTSPVANRPERDTFVIVMSSRKIDWENPPLSVVYRLTDDEVEEAVRKAAGIVLTDDFAPVDNLLAPIASSRR